MGIIITSIKVFDKNCIDCARHKRHAMIVYTSDNPEDITDIFLTQDQVKDLADDLVIVTKRNEAKATERKYIVKGNHPIFKYVDLIVNGESNLHNKMHELLANGYEVVIKAELTKQINKPESLGDILRSAINAKDSLKEG